MKLLVRSDFEPIDPSLVPMFVSNATMGQYFQVAIVSVLAYDIIITMDKEVRYFWVCIIRSKIGPAALIGMLIAYNLKKSPRKLVTIVYFVNRYVGLLGAIAPLFWNIYSTSLPTCNFALWSQNISYWITIILIDCKFDILVIRVLALYSHDKKLSVFLGTLLALEAAFKLGVIIYGTLFNGIAVGGVQGVISFCGSDRFAPWEWGFVDWLIPMLYGLLLMVLALYKANEFWRMSAGLKGFPLVKVLIQDQLIYFILVVSCCVFNILQYKVQVSNAFVADVLVSLGSPSFMCILGSRMLVNLKEAGERGLNEGTSYRMKSVSEMEFC